MNIQFSKDSYKKVQRLTAKNFALKQQLGKTLKLMRENLHHPSLRLHKLQGKEIYSVSVSMSIRIIFRKTQDILFLIDIGTHDEVY